MTKQTASLRAALTHTYIRVHLLSFISNPEKDCVCVYVCFNSICVISVSAGYLPLVSNQTQGYQHITSHKFLWHQTKGNWMNTNILLEEKPSAHFCFNMWALTGTTTHSKRGESEMWQWFTDAMCVCPEEFMESQRVCVWLQVVHWTCSCVSLLRVDCITSSLTSFSQIKAVQTSINWRLSVCVSQRLGVC